MNVSRQFAADDLKRVKERIAALEAHTDAEVVCAIATESGRYDRAESLGGLLLGLVALITGNKFISLHDWDPAAALPVSLQVLLMVGGVIAGSVLTSYGHPFRRLLVFRREMAEEVTRSAHQIFSQRGIGATRHRGGLLIYLSFFERRLEVLGDSAVMQKLSQADLETIRDATLENVRLGEPIQGLLAGLDRAQEKLAKVLPATKAMTTALPNELLVFHPRP